MKEDSREPKGVEEIIRETLIDCEVWEKSVHVQNFIDEITDILTAERNKRIEAEKEVGKLKELLNQAVFRPKNPLDALSYNELQSKLAEAEKRIAELESAIKLNVLDDIEIEKQDKNIQALNSQLDFTLRKNKELSEQVLIESAESAKKISLLEAQLKSAREALANGYVTVNGIIGQIKASELDEHIKSYCESRERIARDNALEEACRAMCEGCMNGLNLREKFGRKFEHERKPKASAPYWFECGASAIRATLSRATIARVVAEN